MLDDFFHDRVLPINLPAYQSTQFFPYEGTPDHNLSNDHAPLSVDSADYIPTSHYQNSPSTDHDSESECIPLMNPDINYDRNPLNNDLRRSSRVSNRPPYLEAYHCSFLKSSHYLPTHTVQYPISDIIPYSKLSPSHTSFICTISSNTEPQTYADAVHSSEWKEAMTNELAALESNGTWTIQSLPVGKKPVACKWVYKLKYHYDGTLERHKDRLVTKGFTHQEGIDFLETFSPVAKMVTVKVLMSLVASLN